MRTQDRQVLNIADARENYRDAVVEAIRTSEYVESDQETMIRIVSARNIWEALQLYLEADTAVRDYIMDIIEETIQTEEESK